MIDNKTQRLSLPLPNVDNYLEDDVVRLSEALEILDAKVATVGDDGKIQVEQLPAIALTDTFPVASQEEMLSLNAQPGDVAIRSDVSKSFILMTAPSSVLANWKELLNNGFNQVKDALSQVSGSLTGTPEETPVPSHSNPDLGPALNAQAQALLNRHERFKQDLAANGGAGLVGLLQSTIERETPFVSPEMYGATDVATSADTQALIDAFNTAKTMNLAVKLSRIYECASNISVTNFYSDVFGVSMATSGIKFAAGCGLVIDNSGTTVVRKPVGLFNFTMKATGQLQGTALTFNGNGGIAYARQLIVRDLDVSNDAGTQSSFDTVFKLSRAGQCVFDGVNVTGGGTSVPAYRMGKIFDLCSTKNINIVNGSYQNFDTFVYAHDDTEGVVVFGNHAIAGRRGVVSENNVGNLFQVTNNHFNTSLSAVELGDLSDNGGNHSVITDNFCMVWNGIPEDETTPYIGFKSCAMYGTYSDNEVLLSGFTKDVTHTLFASNTAGTRTAQYNIVSNPRVNNCTRGIHMLAGTQSNHVSNVQRVGVTLANAIVDEGANNRSWMFDVDNNAFMTRTIKLCTPGTAVTQQIRFHSTTDSTQPSAILRVSGGVAGVGGDGTAELTAGTSVFKNIRPSSANTYSCGASGAPWAGGFTQTAFTVTSDADYKSDPLLMTDDILDAAEEVQLVQYKYLDRIEEKGADGARWHFGAIAQRYVEAFERHGLDAHRFGFICYDEWGDAPAVIDEDNGEVITPAIEAGSRYGIRYEEMLVMEAALQRRNYQRLLARVEALEKELGKE